MVIISLTLIFYSYRYDCEANKHYVLDEKTGQQLLCDPQGNLPLKFIANKTGHMGFNERQKLAQTVIISYLLIFFYIMINSILKCWQIYPEGIEHIVTRKIITPHKLINSRDTLGSQDKSFLLIKISYLIEQKALKKRFIKRNNRNL